MTVRTSMDFFISNVAMGIQIDDDTFAELAKDAANMADLIRKTGRSNVSSSFVDIKNRIIRLRVDTSHFKNSTASKKNGKWRTAKLTADEVFVKGRRGRRREKATTLKSMMLQSGFNYAYNECGVSDSYNGKPIALQIDHINGDSTDNAKVNLRFLCPNCHSQTDNFGHKNIKSKTNPYKIIKPKVKSKKESKKILMKCIGCNSGYGVYEHRVKTSKYCSRKCYDAYGELRH